MIKVLIITILSAIAGRAHGTEWTSWSRLVAKLFLGALLGVGNFYLYHIWWVAALVGLLTVAAISTGHGRVYVMKGADPRQKQERIEKLFGWLWLGDIYKPSYSWFMMGMKGLLVALPIFPFGLVNCITWPASYYFGYKYFRGNVFAEYLSCGILGLMTMLIIILN